MATWTHHRAVGKVRKTASWLQRPASLLHFHLDFREGLPSATLVLIFDYHLQKGDTELEVPKIQLERAASTVRGPLAAVECGNRKLIERQKCPQRGLVNRRKKVHIENAVMKRNCVGFHKQVRFPSEASRGCPHSSPIHAYRRQWRGIRREEKTRGRDIQG